MGLLSFLAGVATLPVKIAELPVRTLETALGDKDHVISGELKKVRKVVEEAADEIEDT